MERDARIHHQAAFFLPQFHQQPVDLAVALFLLFRREIYLLHRESALGGHFPKKAARGKIFVTQGPGHPLSGAGFAAAWKSGDGDDMLMHKFLIILINLIILTRPSVSSNWELLGQLEIGTIRLISIFQT